MSSCSGLLCYKSCCSGICYIKSEYSESYYFKLLQVEVVWLVVPEFGILRANVVRKGVHYTAVCYAIIFYAVPLRVLVSQTGVATKWSSQEFPNLMILELKGLGKALVRR